MFFNYAHPSIRFTGRFAEYTANSKPSMTATACGSYIEIAFCGDKISLYFDTTDFEPPYPNVWVELDSHEKHEATITPILSINCKQNKKHTLKITFKSCCGHLNRFRLPLVSKLSFIGYEADDSSVLPEDNRKTIEVIGDSITEGCWVNRPLLPEGTTPYQFEPYINDAHGTYAYEFIKHYNLRPFHASYGGVGVGISWADDVPVAKEYYPYCFEGASVAYTHPDYVLISLGTNDARNMPDEKFINDYREFLKLVRNTHPKSIVICVTPFNGALADIIANIVEGFADQNMHCIKNNWGKGYDLHPNAAQHKIMGKELIKATKNIIK